MKWETTVCVFLAGMALEASAAGAAAQTNLLVNADFQQPQVVCEGKEPPYAVAEGWAVEGLVRIGHPLQTAPGTRQVVRLVKGSVEQMLSGKIEENSFYDIRIRLRDDGFVLPSCFEAVLSAVDADGNETELVRLGARDDGTSFGHAVPLQSGEWQTQTAMWNSALHPERVGSGIKLRIAGQRIEVSDAGVEKRKEKIPTSEVWRRERVRLNEDPAIEAVTVLSYFYGYNSGVKRVTTGQDEEPAYDYSANLVYDTQAGLYRLFTGGRWRDEAKGWDGDHILQQVSKTGEGYTWEMPHDPPRPETTQGRFEGEGPDYDLEQWWTGNYMDPEVVKVDDTYYLFTQVQVNPGNILDPKTGLRAESGADRVQLHTSQDGRNWKRWSRERGVIVNIDNPAHLLMTHHEALYVPWDKQAPWWLYVNTFEDYVRGSRDNRSQFYLVRSDDPTTFDWQHRTAVTNFMHLGNQTGYCRQAPGGPLFVRITHSWFKKEERQLPVLQYSRDGLRWSTLGVPEYPARLDGSKNEVNNRNCYFPGFSTLDGTGELQYLGDGWYRAVYGTATTNGGGQPHIWHSEIGTGIFYLHLEAAR